VSYSVDAQVLLYASDAGSPFHRRAIAFLDACSRRSEPLCLGWPTVMAYLRIATHPRIFARPLSPDDAARNVESLMALPQLRLLSEGDGYWESFRVVTRGKPVRGNLVPDAHLAALLHLHDVRTLYTTDSDFRKFDVLDARDPFSDR
jgi:toxin-antitoxin system PIN domain toxin